MGKLLQQIFLGFLKYGIPDAIPQDRLNAPAEEERALLVLDAGVIQIGLNKIVPAHHTDQFICQRGALLHRGHRKINMPLFQLKPQFPQRNPIDIQMSDQR